MSTSTPAYVDYTYNLSIPPCSGCGGGPSTSIGPPEPELVEAYLRGEKIGLRNTQRVKYYLNKDKHIDKSKKPFFNMTPEHMAKQLGRTSSNVHSDSDASNASSAPAQLPQLDKQSAGMEQTHPQTGSNGKGTIRGKLASLFSKSS